MCNFMGHIVSKVQYIKLKQIEKDLGTLAALKELKIMKDGFRYEKSAIIKANKERNEIIVEAAHWEFIPNWIKSMEEMKEQRKKGIPFLNAKSENLFLNDKGKPAMWANAAMNSRCLVIATHFYEWRHYKSEGAKKPIAYPYVIHKPNYEQFYMAGIYNNWTDKETGENMDTFAIVTTKANSLMQQIHNTKNRMPTILNEELAYRWLFENLTKEDIFKIASYQLPSTELVAHTISKEFKILENPLDEFIYDELPLLEAV
jgi:putative SOS response-associated peptidase YedK